jgi:CSLREA domain-containing protein
VLLASLVGLAACSGQGQTVEPDLFVTKPDDTFDGACLPRDCSLREAVAAANQAPGPNTIQSGPQRGGVGSLLAERPKGDRAAPRGSM